jgi:phage-related holin
MAGFLNVVAGLGHLPSILDAFFLASLTVVHGGTMVAAWCDVAMQFGFVWWGLARRCFFFGLLVVAVLMGWSVVVRLQCGGLDHVG